ncbi:MAG: hypothetical protein ACE5G8_07555, partial [Anaerolineae bacterium]
MSQNQIDLRVAQLLTDRRLAMQLAGENRPCFYTEQPKALLETIEVRGQVQHVIRRRYPGLF